MNSSSWSDKSINGSGVSSYLAVDNFSLGSITPSCIMVLNRSLPSEQNRPYLVNSPVNFGFNWFGQGRTYMTGFDATNTGYAAYTFQNNFHNATGFNTTSVEIAGVGSPILQPFFVYQNNTFQGDLNQYGSPSPPFNSRQNFIQQLQLYYGTQQVSFLLFINGRGANNLRSLYRSTMGTNLNIPY
jgi:hypothetical protein